MPSGRRTSIRARSPRSGSREAVNLSYNSGPDASYLGLADSDFAAIVNDNLYKTITGLTQNCDAVAAYGFTYTGGDGIHDIHMNSGYDASQSRRRPAPQDGAIAFYFTWSPAAQQKAFAQLGLHQVRRPEHRRRVRSVRRQRSPSFPSRVSLARTRFAETPRPRISTVPLARRAWKLAGMAGAEDGNRRLLALVPLDVPRRREPGGRTVEELVGPGPRDGLLGLDDEPGPVEAIREFGRGDAPALFERRMRAGVARGPTTTR